jgi:hypothetical protein
VFTEAIAQALGECFADSPSTQVLLDTYCRTLRVMVAAKRAARRWRRRTLKGK